MKWEHGTNGKWGRLEATAGFRAESNKTEAIILGTEKREEGREKGILGEGNYMCKGPEA